MCILLLFDIRVSADIYLAFHKVLRTKTFNSCSTQWTSDWGVHTIFVRGRGLKKVQLCPLLKLSVGLPSNVAFSQERECNRFGHLHQKHCH